MSRSLPWKQVAVTAAVAGVVVWRVHFSALRDAFRNLNAGSLLLAGLCLLVLLSVRVYKWHRLMDEGLGNVCLRRSLRSIFGGFGLVLLTPGRLGEMGRCLFVPKNERFQVGALNLLDRLFDLWALLTLTAASLFFLIPRPIATFGLGVWLAFLPLIAGLPRLLAYLAKFLRKPQHVQRQIINAAGVLARIEAPRYAVLALCSIWVELASFFFLLRAFHPVGFITVLATYPYCDGRCVAGFVQRHGRARGRRGFAACPLCHPCCHRRRRGSTVVCPHDPAARSHGGSLAAQ